MGLTYFKRYRMEIALSGRQLALPVLPPGYRLIPWQPELLCTHAEVKHRSFTAEIDANVFPCLGDGEGCLRLMREISHKPGFLAEATWLVAYEPPGESRSEYCEPEYCGTVQGIKDRTGIGAIQNLGVLPEQRGQGLGAALLLAALQGFREVGLGRAFLEVTAQNSGAIRLYRNLGFRTARTVYKAVEAAPLAAT